MRFFMILALTCASAHAFSIDDMVEQPKELTPAQTKVYNAANEFLSRDSVRAFSWLAEWDKKFEQKTRDNDTYSVDRFISERASKFSDAIGAFVLLGAAADIAYNDKREFARLVVFAKLRHADLPDRIKNYLEEADHAEEIVLLLAPPKEKEDKK